MMNHSILRIAAAVPSIRVGHPLYNANEIARLIRFAHEHEHASIVVLPELALVGHARDALLLSDVQRNIEAATRELLRDTAECDCVAVVGTVLPHGGRLRSAALLIYKGEVVGIACEPLHDMPIQMCMFGKEYTLWGTQFAVWDDCRFAVHVGDIAQYDGNAPLVLNPTASPHLIGQQTYNTTMVKAKSYSGCAVVRVGAGAADSTTECVYDGHICIAEAGEVIVDTTAMSLSNRLIATEVDLELCRSRRADYGRGDYPCAIRIGNTTYGDSRHMTVTIPDAPRAVDALRRKPAQYPFVPDDPAEQARRFTLIYETAAAGLAKRLTHAGNAKPVLALSGGLDSTAALLITLRALQLCNRPRTDLIALTMPCFGTGRRTYGNTHMMCQALGIELREIGISDAVTRHLEDISHSGSHDVAFENAQARERTQIALDIASYQGGLMVGTCDMSEIALGFATYGGDHLSMYAVNCGIPKTVLAPMIRYLAKLPEYVAAHDALCDVADTPISPELLPPDDSGAMTQRTEEILGEYRLLDFILYHMLRNRFSREKTAFLARQAFHGVYADGYIDKCVDTFVRRFYANTFKRRCAPDGVRVGALWLPDLDIPGDIAML